MQNTRSFTTAETFTSAATVHTRAISVPNPELLRSVGAWSIMKCFGQVLQNSQGGADSYMLSKVVSQIDCFLSHNWKTSRVLKFLVIAVHFNLNAAMAMLMTTNAVILMLLMTGWIKPIELETGDGGSFQLIPYFVLLDAPAFMLVLLFKHDILGGCGYSGPGMFLDKACIHQTDRELQQQGVRSLAAFMRNSKSVLVVYTELYLQRLWTVYEVAACLLVNPDADLRILPVSLPLVIISISTVNYLLGLTRFLCNAFGLAMAGIDGLIAAVMATLVWLMLWHWSREQNQIRTKLAAFRVQAADCVVEADREVVETNIVSFMLVEGFAASDSSHEQALHAFDEIVRKHLPGALEASCGRLGLRYVHALAMCLPLLSSSLEGFASFWLSAELGGGSIAIYASGVLVLVANVVPNCIALSALICRKLSAWGARGYFLLAGVACIGLFLVIIAIHMILLALASTSGAPALMTISCLEQALHVVATVLLYRADVQTARRRRPSMAQPSQAAASGMIDEGQLLATLPGQGGMPADPPGDLQATLSGQGRMPADPSGVMSAKLSGSGGMPAERPGATPVTLPEQGGMPAQLPGDTPATLPGQGGKPIQPPGAAAATAGPQELAEAEPDLLWQPI